MPALTIDAKKGRARAHELRTGDEILWRDGTSVLVHGATDDEERGVVELELGNGRSTTVRRRRMFRLILRTSSRAGPL